MREEEIFEFLQELIKKIREVDTELKADTALVSQGILDSLEFMNYITKIEEKFNLDINDIEIEEKQLGILKNMQEYISKKVN